MSVTPFTGHRDVPPPPPVRSPWRAFLFAAMFALMLAAVLFMLYADTQARMDDLRQPTLAPCRATTQTVCVIDTSSGPVEISVGYGGQVYASTEAPRPSSVQGGRYGP